MAEKQLNPGSSFDLWLGVLALLFVSGPVGRLLGPVLKPLVAGPHAEHDFVLGLIYLGLIVIAAVVFDKVRASTGKSRTCCVVFGAFMALAGAFVLFLLTFMLMMGAVYVIDLVLPKRVGEIVLDLWPLWGTLPGAYWAGWRFGAWGFVWGVCAALTWMAVLVAQGTMSDGAFPLTAWMVGRGVGAVVVGAFAGALGATRFQQTLARERAATGAPATAGPGGVGWE
jgi:hypothetical protein